MKGKEVIVVGAGPAGMMAAVKAAEAGAKVTLLEKMKRPGRKLMITGKGRCNVTNAADIPELIKNMVGNGKFLHSALRAFDNQEVMEFFERLGVPLKVERGNRVFPVSDKAMDIVDAFLSRLHELGVKLLTATTVREIISKDGKISAVRLADDTMLSADGVILATGGATYPKTGSSGDGYPMAERLGHTITAITPALVPLETEEEWVKDLQGLALKNVRAALLVDGKVEVEQFGEMLFAHFGVTGPIILSLSRCAAIRLAEGKFVELHINLKPALTPEQLQARIRRDFEKYAKKQLKNAMVDLLPSRMIPVVLDVAFLDGEKTIAEFSQKECRRLVETLRALPLVVTRTRPLAEGIVTAGGIATKEINPKTMESKLVKGLYFVGEVVDVDGLTGGYNLQAAFSMGAAAGRSVAEKER